MSLEDLAFDALKGMPPAEAYSSLFDQLDDLISDQAEATVNYLKDKSNDPSEIKAVAGKVKTLRRLKERLDKETNTKTTTDGSRPLQL